MRGLERRVATAQYLHRVLFLSDCRAFLARVAVHQGPLLPPSHFLGAFEARETATGLGSFYQISRHPSSSTREWDDL